MPKPHFRQTLATLAAVAGTTLAVNAQTTTFTAPSGYTTITAAAATNATTPKYSFVSHSLARKRQAAAVLSSGGTDSLTVTGAGWTADEFAGTPHYVLIASGDTSGDVFDIIGNDATSLTLKAGSGDFSSVDFVGVSITIYQHNTLASVFGSDPTTKGLLGGLDADSADQILLYEDGSGFTTYFYKDTNIPDFLNPNDKIAWVTSADNENDYSNTPLPPNRGFIIMRRPTSEYGITVFGDVIDDDVNVPIADGYNLICVPYPIPDSVTLDDSGLYDATDTGFIHSLQPGLDADTAELVVMWSGSGYIQYFYKDQNIPDFLNPNDKIGWVTSADNENLAGSTPMNGSFFILRKAPNPALNWVFPSVVTP